MTDNQTADMIKSNKKTWIFEKEVPLGEGLPKQIGIEIAQANTANVEINIEKRGSHFLLRVETSDDDAALNHKLLSDGFVVVKND